MEVSKYLATKRCSFSPEVHSFYEICGTFFQDAQKEKEQVELSEAIKNSKIFRQRTPSISQEGQYIIRTDPRQKKQFEYIAQCLQEQDRFSRRTCLQ